MRLYRALLHLYPASFRREYGAPLRQAFAARRAQVHGVLGWVLLWVETVPDVIGNAAVAHWDILRQDLRYARRSLARTPAFAVTAILVTALGVGANAAAFSVTDFVLVRRLPFANPDRLVRLWQDGDQGLQLSPADYRDWRRDTRSFEDMAAFSLWGANLVMPDRAVRVQAAWVSHDLTRTLGVSPLLGRSFTAEDDRSGAPGTVLLSYSFWRDGLGGDRSVVGRTLTLDGATYQVIGVMPPEFRFPTRSVQVWVPFRFDETSADFQDRTNHYLDVVARLRPGVTLARARADVAEVARRLAPLHAADERASRGAVLGLRRDIQPRARLLLWALSGASLCILLIACANLGNLLLVRGVGRRHEVAVRTALGAGRERLVRQMITETLVLVGSGWALGIGVGAAVVPLLGRLVPDALPVAEGPSMDGRVLALAGALTLAASLVFALQPAWRAARRTGLDALREDGRGGGGRRTRVRAALVVTEVAGSVVLLVAAGLLLRAITRIQEVAPGFDPGGVLTLRTALPSPRYASVRRREAFYRSVIEKIDALPGVTSAAYVSGLPMVWGGGIWPVAVPGAADAGGARPTASLRLVTPGYFATMGIPVREGRDVSVHDTRDSPWVAVVSVSFARRWWPGGDAIGKRFTMAFHEREVVGVVGDVKMRGLERTNEPQVYLPSAQVGDSSLVGYWPKDLAIRSSSPPSALLPAIRRIVRQADPEEPVSGVRTMSEIVQAQTAPRSVQLRLLGAFAVLALLLAGLGIQGVVAFGVSERAREIGVRRALGARTGHVMVMVLRMGFVPTSAGLALGIALAVLAARAMRGVLFGVPPSDPLTFGAAIALCAVTTLAGCLLPARRAARVDPMSVMRSE